jgi:hypothetical protein
MKARNQGIDSKNVTRPQYKSGPGARAANPKWAASVGEARGNRAQSGVEGGGGVVLKGEGVRPSPYKGASFNPVRQGNEVAAATVCGPGGSRTVMRSGQQGTHGSVNPGGPKLTNTRGQWPDSK